MAFYTICGKPDCINLSHATYVAQYLYEHLPNFKYKKIEKSKSEWPRFVTGLNKRNKWFVVDSPIIWKEISSWGGKPYLIGDLGAFWEYCYCYYGLESTIPRADLKKLAYDNSKFYKEERERHLKARTSINVVISVFGACRHPMTPHLLESFLQIPEFLNGNGFLVKLYQENFDSAEFEQERKSLEDILHRFNSLSTFGKRKVVYIVDDEEEAVTDADLLIMLEDHSRHEGEPFELYRRRCVSRVAMLSDSININSKRSLRIVFANEGAMCLMATCMVEYCTILVPSNIVVLAADRGLPVVNALSQLTGVPTSKIGAPPVWGFLGFKEFIDEANALFMGYIYRPYERALTAPEGSTLPLGTVVPELRLMSNLVSNQHAEITQIVQERKAAIESRLQRKPFLPKLRALISLLKLWYAEEPSDQIISLGIRSDGSYGIPRGMIFSQPAIQDKKRRWKPFPNFPLINEATKAELKNIIHETVKVLATLFSIHRPTSDIFLQIFPSSIDLNDVATVGSHENENESNASLKSTSM